MMVTERKPIFVSKDAHALLRARAEETKTFIGDQVDILLGLKEVGKAQEENKNYFKDLATN
jgi:hypothetical protein